jgi:hypothetical protein
MILIFEVSFFILLPRPFFLFYITKSLTQTENIFLIFVFHDKRDINICLIIWQINQYLMVEFLELFF